MKLLLPPRCAAVVLLFSSLLLSSAAEIFRVAAYNVENYLDKPTESRKSAKSATAKSKVHESILAMKPDVIALEEMGETNALLELRDSLKVDGLDLPYWEHITAWDTNIHVCVLSRFPITDRRSHTNDTFLLSGRRLHVGRGFIEVDIQVNINYSFTLFGAHLKSQRPVPVADQAEWRLEEARLLREHIEARLATNDNANIIALGDFNDIPSNLPVETLIGRGKHQLVDTRPAERNGDDKPNPTNPRRSPRNIVWTHYYGVDDSYSRLDYILLSPGMAREWLKDETYIPTIPNWGIGSDHRPVVAGFVAVDR